MKVSLSKREKEDIVHVQGVMVGPDNLRGDYYDEVRPGQALLGIPYAELVKHVGETLELESLQTQQK